MKNAWVSILKKTTRNRITRGMDASAGHRSRFTVLRTRLAFAVTGCLLGLGVFIFRSEVAGASVTIVEEHQPRAAVVLPAEPRPREQHGAEELVEYVYRSTSARFPLVCETTLPTEHLVHIHVGDTRKAQAHPFWNTTFEPDSFEIAFQDQAILIRGQEPSGTLFGVYDFLERYLDIAWLNPGELWEYVPEVETLSIPAVDIREAPSFRSRMISQRSLWGLRGLGDRIPARSEQRWGLRMRINPLIEFHHHIYHLFGYETGWRDKDPRLYPLIDGERYRPQGPRNRDDRTHWHLCFSYDKSPEITASIINDFFSGKDTGGSFFFRNDYSVSVGINDSSGGAKQGVCECDRCIPLHRGDNSMNRVDISEAYYAWVNDVMERVLAVHDDKYIGLLAYYQTFDPPSFPLHDNVVPYICFDTLQFVHPRIRQHKRSFHDRWMQRAHEAGWYDYYYGLDSRKPLPPGVGDRSHTTFVPRLYPRHITRTYRDLAENGVRYYYAEVHNETEDIAVSGPKLFHLLKTVWDVSADADELIEEWCVKAVGREAAPALIRYYRFWEDFWTERWPASSTSPQSETTYLGLRSGAYISLLTRDDFRTLDAWMDEVVALASDGKQAQRARYLHDVYTRMKNNVIEIVAESDWSKAMSDQRITAAEDRVRFGFATAEDRPASWMRMRRAGVFFHAPDVGHKTPGALGIRAANTGGGIALWTLSTGLELGHDLVPDRLYRFSGWVKTRNVRDGAIRASLRFSAPGAEGNPRFDLPVSVPSPMESHADTSWRRIDRFFRTWPDGMTRLSLNFGVDGMTDGMVYFDDFSIAEVRVDGEEDPHRLPMSTSR